VQSPPFPENESARQDALERTGLLQTGENKDLQDIVELAATICQVPMAMVSLIDRDRQVHKARVGIDAPGLPRALSICGHAILGPDPFIVPDATADERFATNPLVTGPMHIRFYAGIPLIVDGDHALGALCILDTQPRELDDRTRDSLQRLARIARISLQQFVDAGDQTK
jgi:GAF domain-containing protein